MYKTLGQIKKLLYTTTPSDKKVYCSKIETKTNNCQLELGLLETMTNQISSLKTKEHTNASFASKLSIILYTPIQTCNPLSEKKYGKQNGQYFHFHCVDQTEA